MHVMNRATSVARPLGDSSTERIGGLSTGILLGRPTGAGTFKAQSAPLNTPNTSELFVLINRAELAGFRHYAAALRATLPNPPATEAVQHPLGGYTHAVPHKNGTCRIYSGWWSTMAKAVAALPKSPALSHLNPKTT